MSRTLTAADRSALIRLASTMEPGSPERKAILAGLEKSALSEPGDPYGKGVVNRESLGDDIEKSLVEYAGRVLKGMGTFYTYPEDSEYGQVLVDGRTARNPTFRRGRGRDEVYEVFFDVKVMGSEQDPAYKAGDKYGLKVRFVHTGRGAFDWFVEDAGRRKTAGLEKSASRMGVDIFRSFVDPKKYIATRRNLSMDKQSQDLLRQVQRELLRRLTPDDSTERALNRLSNLLSGSQDPAVLRNQIFKVANELGIRLPSGMF